MFVAHSRQDTDLLFPVRPPNAPGPFPELLGAGASKVYGPFVLQGFSTVDIFAVSDQPFSITIEEAVLEDGPYVVTQTFSSEASGSLFVLCERFSPIGAFGKATVQNTGGAGQSQMSLSGRGIPLP